MGEVKELCRDVVSWVRIVVGRGWKMGEIGEG